MATPQRIKKNGTNYYRVQVRRPSKGVNIDEYFTTKRAADRYLRRISEKIENGEPILQNVQQLHTFVAAVEAYLADPRAFTNSKGRTLSPSYQKDRKERLNWLSAECFGAMQLKHLTWRHIDDVLAAKAVERTWSTSRQVRCLSCIAPKHSAASALVGRTGGEIGW